MATAKMTTRQQVVRYCQEQGLKACGRHGVPMLSCAATDWAECFDNWQKAYAFLRAAKEAKDIHAHPFPWL